MTSLAKTSKFLTLTASSMLLGVATLHGSGIVYMRDIVNESNLSDMIKNIFPVLFILPSIQLIGLALFGWLSIKLPAKGAFKILIVTIFMILIDASLSFYLGAIAPGVILLIPAIMYSVLLHLLRKKGMNHDALDPVPNS